MQQRYYDPAIGRFLSVDPMASDVQSGWNFNRYSYGANNPYLYIDPDGRMRAAFFNMFGPPSPTSPHRDRAARGHAAMATLVAAPAAAGAAGGALWVAGPVVTAAAASVLETAASTPAGIAVLANAPRLVEPVTDIVEVVATSDITGPPGPSFASMATSTVLLAADIEAAKNDTLIEGAKQLLGSSETPAPSPGASEVPSLDSIPKPRVDDESP